MISKDVAVVYSLSTYETFRIFSLVEFWKIAYNDAEDEFTSYNIVRYLRAFNVKKTHTARRKRNTYSTVTRVYNYPYNYRFAVVVIDIDRSGRAR